MILLLHMIPTPENMIVIMIYDIPTEAGYVCKRARFYYPCAYIPTYIAQWYLAGALFIISSKQIIPIDGKTIYIACMCMYMYNYFHISTPSSLSPSNLPGSQNSYSYIPVYTRVTYMHTLTYCIGS